MLLSLEYSDSIITAAEFPEQINLDSMSCHTNNFNTEINIQLVNTIPN